ncbi:MAG: AAA family ATPase, partial [Duncaniella sp.]|nr:AAA family ATPase [Duncaniella sp.]
MTVSEFAGLVKGKLPYEPNGQQEQLIGALARFCSSATPSDSVFIVNGYAGTGKTSLTGALVKALEEVGRKVVLLAPTGRAAKVFSAHAGHPASTIHR